MGFCRRCGDIVVGARCKCGGTAVAPVVPWNQSTTAHVTQDRWSKTYVHRARSVSPIRPVTTQITGPTTTALQTSPTKRFPRQISHIQSPSSELGSRVTAHITSSTSHSSRPPSPLKYSNTAPAPEADILPSLHDTTLSKVYGSVLQPKETLITHSCARCSSPFPPDATIYPDPEAPSTSRFLCRPCYEVNGGTKGTCPTCARPVFTLKSEGGFIHAAAQYWHRKCFNCSGCFKNIADSPIVDLLGRPCCTGCFENCLKRDPATPKKYASTSNSNSPSVGKANNPGGMSASSRSRQSREGSPAIEELEQRLGITKSREGSPALEDLSRRLARLGQPSSSRYSDGSSAAGIYAGCSESSHLDRLTDERGLRTDNSARPIRSEHMRSPEFESRNSPGPSKPGSHGPVRHHSGSPSPTLDAVEEMKQRLMKTSHSPHPSRPTRAESSMAQGTAPLRLSRSSTSLCSSTRLDPLDSDAVPTSPLSPAMPLTPDFMSDFSDSMTQSSFSGPDSPPRNREVEDIFNVTKTYGTNYGLGYPRRDFLDKTEEAIIEETASELGTPTRTPGSTRARMTPDLREGSIVSTISPFSPLKPRPVNSSRREVPGLQISTGPSDSASSSCEGCRQNLFSIRGGGKFVTVPGDSANSPSLTYHVNCFTCVICHGVFSEAGTGRAVFVKTNGGACHIECAPPTKILIHKMPSSESFDTALASTTTSSKSGNPVPMTTTQSTHTSSSRLERPPLTAPPTSGSSSFPRFGSRTTCPGCNKSVSPMEQGVVPGPQGTRWHGSCLVCGGKKQTPKGFGIWRGREEKKGMEPGCGKRLDSAAKTGVEGDVWCRECLLLLGVGGALQASPTRAPLVPSFTGASKVTPQLTGTTTLARQFTGIGSSGDPGLLRQLTGGGSSPTRGVSPTKQVGGLGGVRPRPKSVIGMRTSKSVDEGRGMFLVGQLTGAG